VQLPEILQGETRKRLMQGAFIGFLATVIIGFNWGGWTLESTAKLTAEKNTSGTLVAVLAPICADNFRRSTEAALNMSELKKVASWQQDSFIQKGGWATFPGLITPDPAIAEACAKLLTSLH
jgi:hypothetical protein